MLRQKTERDKRAVKGFRLPMLEYEEDLLDISEQMVVDPDNTYYMKMDSDVMQTYGIFKGNILVIDKSLNPVTGAIVVVYYLGEWYTREYVQQGKSVLLKASDQNASIVIPAGETLQVWGVVMVNVNLLLPGALRKGKYLDVCAC